MFAGMKSPRAEAGSERPSGLLPVAPRYCGVRAFSLVETVMAVGLLTFGLVGLMGLLPAGLHNFREAINRNGQAMALQAVRAEIARQPFSVTAPLEIALDEEGRPLASASDALVFFVVKATPQAGPLGSSNLRTWAVGIDRMPINPAGTPDLQFPICQADFGVQ